MVVKDHKYFKLYKPYGYLSQFRNNQNKRKNKKLLTALHDFPESIMAVGRLDEKSEGLLLLTTDGNFSHYITSSKVEKEYHVMVDGIIDKKTLNTLSLGVTISVNGTPYTTKKCNVELLNNTDHIASRFVRSEKHGPTSWIAITLTEGKFRQVRKMTAAVGFPTLRIVRVRVGNYTLDALRPGDLAPIHY